MRQHFADLFEDDLHLRMRARVAAASYAREKAQCFLPRRINRLISDGIAWLKRAVDLITGFGLPETSARSAARHFRHFQPGRAA